MYYASDANDILVMISIILSTNLVIGRDVYEMMKYCDFGESTRLCHHVKSMTNSFVKYRS